MEGRAALAACTLKQSERMNGGGRGAPACRSRHSDEVGRAVALASKGGDGTLRGRCLARDADADADAGAGADAAEGKGRGPQGPEEDGETSEWVRVADGASEGGGMLNEGDGREMGKAASKGLFWVLGCVTG